LPGRYIDKDNWSVACNTSDLRWLLDESVLPRGYTYMFRVQAHNLNGWGPDSLNGTIFSYPSMFVLGEFVYKGVIMMIVIIELFKIVLIIK